MILCEDNQDVVVVRCVGENQLADPVTGSVAGEVIVILFPSYLALALTSHPPAVTINTILPSLSHRKINFHGAAESRAQHKQCDDASKVSFAPLSQQ